MLSTKRLVDVHGSFIHHTPNWARPRWSSLGAGECGTSVQPTLLASDKGRATDENVEHSH